MTDPVPTDGQQSEEQVSNFGWWLCMLPFVVGALVFTYKWWLAKAEDGSTVNLLYGFGVLILGVIFSALVSGGSDDPATTSSGTATGDKTQSS